MRQNIRLAVTGVVAVGAVVLSVWGPGFAHFRADGPAPPSAASLAALKNFEGVTLAGPDRVIVTQAKAFSVRAEGDPRVLARLRVYVRSGTLHVERREQGGWFSLGDTGATIRVALPVLSRVTLAGSGDMSVEKLSGRRVWALLTGTGDVTIKQVDADEANLVLNGSGDLAASGRAKSVLLSETGSGDLRARDLAAETATLKLTGSGDIQARASRSANIAILGSGDAHVAGTIACRISKMGSGEAHCAT